MDVAQEDENGQVWEARCPFLLGLHVPEASNTTQLCQAQERIHLGALLTGMIQSREPCWDASRGWTPHQQLQQRRAIESGTLFHGAASTNGALHEVDWVFCFGDHFQRLERHVLVFFRKLLPQPKGATDFGVIRDFCVQLLPKPSVHVPHAAHPVHPRRALRFWQVMLPHVAVHQGKHTLVPSQIRNCPAGFVCLHQFDCFPQHQAQYGCRVVPALVLGTSMPDRKKLVQLARDVHRLLQTLQHDDAVGYLKLADIMAHFYVIDSLNFCSHCFQS